MSGALVQDPLPLRDGWALLRDAIRVAEAAGVDAFAYTIEVDDNGIQHRDHPDGSITEAACGARSHQQKWAGSSVVLALDEAAHGRGITWCPKCWGGAA